MLVQSCVLILVLLIMTLLLRQRAKAVFLYALWMLLLVKLVLPVGLALPSSPTYWARQHLPEIGRSETPLTSRDRAISNPPTASTATPAPLQSAVEPRPAMTQVKAATPPEAPTWQPPVNPSQNVTHQQNAASLSWQALAMLAWLTTVCVMMGLLVQRAFFVNSLIRQSRPADARLRSQLKRCAIRMKFRRRVDLRLSPNATSPSVCGLLRPVILIPDNLTGDLNAGQTKAVFIHELAHIKRGDLWVNLIQALLQILYFYNPMLWVANSIIRKIREQAVDETVLVVMNDHAKDYPDTLLTVSKLVWSKPTLSLRLIGVVESKHALAGRINHILSRPFPKSTKLGMVGLAAILIAAAVLLPMAEAQSDIDVKVHDMTISSGHGKTAAEKNIEYAGGSELMRAYMAALLADDAETLGQITSTANETTQQLRLSFNEIDKLGLIRTKSHYTPSLRRTLSSPDPNINTRIGMFSGGRIKRINGVQYHLLAIIEQANSTPWQLKDARWYRTDREWQESDTRVNAELAQAFVALAAHFKRREASPRDIADIEHEFNQLSHEMVKSLPERGSKTRSVLYGQKVTVAQENVIPVVTSFMESLRQGRADSKDLRCPGSLEHKLERLRELCHLEGLYVKEIYASNSFAIALTEGMQRHDGLPCQLGFTFIVYPHGRWIFKDTDWLTPENRLAFVEGFKAFYPNVLRVFNLGGTPQVRTSVMKAKYEATLPNGVTVELLGVCEHPSTGKPWWSPDGALLGFAPYQKLDDREAYSDLQLYEIVYRVNPSDNSISKIDRTNEIPGSFGPYPISRQTEGVLDNLKDALYAYIPVQDANDQVDLSFSCGKNTDWRTLIRAESPVDRSGMNSDNANIYVSLGQDKRIIAHVTHKLSKEVRVVAKDQDGRLYHPISIRGRGMEFANVLSAAFDLSVDQAAVVEVQVQDFQPITFKNVSLSPNHETHVLIDVEESTEGYQAKTKNSSAEAAFIIQKVRDRYAGIKTFSAVGELLTRVERLRPSMPNKNTNRVHPKGTQVLKSVFTMKLGRPSLYCIEWNENTNTAISRVGNAWSIGNGSNGLINGKELTYEKPLRALIGTASQMGRAQSFLFFDTSLNLFKNLKHLLQKQDEPINGVDCYVVSGKRNRSTHTFWISKTDFQIQQHQSVSEGSAEPEESSGRELSDESITHVLKLQNKEATPQELADFRTQLADARATTSEVIVTKIETYRQITLDQSISKEQCVPSKDIDEVTETLRTLRDQYQSRLQDLSPTQSD